VFQAITNILPFYHGVEAIRTTLNGNFGYALPHLMVVVGYAVIFYALAIIVK